MYSAIRLALPRDASHPEAVTRGRFCDANDLRCETFVGFARGTASCLIRGGLPMIDRIDRIEPHRVSLLLRHTRRESKLLFLLELGR